MSQQSKTLYDQANRAYKAGVDLLAEHGESISPEIRAQVDQHFDEAEQKAEAARRLDRAASIKNALPAPAGDPGAQGAQTGDRAAELKAARHAFGLYAAYGAESLSADQKHAISLGGEGIQWAVSESEVKRAALESKDLSLGDYAAGGALAAPQFRAEVILATRNVSAMRRIARVLPPVASGATITPIQTAHLSDPTWTAEVEAAPQDTVRPLGGRVLVPHMLAKEVLASNTILRASPGTAGSMILEELGYLFGDAMEEGFINGNGARRPLGLLNTAGLPSTTSATNDQVYANDVINWVYDLPSRFFPGARILCHRSFVQGARQIVSMDGTVNATNYLWTPGLAADSPPTIQGVPYDLSDRMPVCFTAGAWVDGATCAVIGDFRYYWIVDALLLQIQRLTEIAARTNQTSFIGRLESDGMAVLAEAFNALVVQ